MPSLLGVKMYGVNGQLASGFPAKYNNEEYYAISAKYTPGYVTLSKLDMHDMERVDNPGPDCKLNSSSLYQKHRNVRSWHSLTLRTVRLTSLFCNGS